LLAIRSRLVSDYMTNLMRVFHSNSFIIFIYFFDSYIRKEEKDICSIDSVILFFTLFFHYSEMSDDSRYHYFFTLCRHMANDTTKKRNLMVLLSLVETFYYSILYYSILLYSTLRLLSPSLALFRLRLSLRFPCTTPPLALARPISPFLNYPLVLLSPY